MGKTIQIASKRWLGLLVTALLLWSLWYGLRDQLAAARGHDWWHIQDVPSLILALLLLPLNIGIETKKWQWLAGSALPRMTFGKALCSVLGGIAFSMITPNRIGEYPGRVIALGGKGAPRLVAVSVLGALSQLLTVVLYGIPGLLYFQLTRPQVWGWPALAVTVAIAVALGLFYWRFERWAPYIERIKWLQRWSRYGRLLQRFSAGQQAAVLGAAVLRFAVFTLQYYFVLKAVGLTLPIGSGFCLCALFFFTMAVVPSIALAEVGIRSVVSVYLLGDFVPDEVALVAATIGIWGMNLVVPAVCGAVVLWRRR